MKMSKNVYKVLEDENIVLHTVPANLTYLFQLPPDLLNCCEKNSLISMHIKLSKLAMWAKEIKKYSHPNREQYRNLISAPVLT